MDTIRTKSLLGAAAVALLMFQNASASAGVTLVRSGDDLQAALNAAQPGDTILLEAGATFTGNFVLPVKSGSAYITVRSATPDGQLPDATTRITPAQAPLLARIRSGNTMSALRTAAGAHHWRLQFLEFPATVDGYGDIIQLGDGSSAQSHDSLVPFELELDRVYIHGDPVMGQKRGIALNARAVTIRNSHVSDIKAVGMDSQAIGGWNGPGPFTIENNYLEAAGENVMLGGSDPSIPNLVSADVTVRQNYLSRPLGWRNPVVPAPAALAGQVAGLGSLPAGSHRYRVVARQRVGGGVIARSDSSTEAVVTISAGAAIRLTWTPVPHAFEYQVYGVGPAGYSQFWTVSTAAFTDTGAAGAAGSAPTTPGSIWTVKNIFELKNARRVVIERNVFENNWAGGQAGYAIVFTPRNQNGTCTWCVVEDVIFRYNIVRQAAAGVNILGYDDLAPSRQTARISISHNLFQLTTSMGGAWFMLLGNMPRDITVDHNTIDADGTTVAYVYGDATGAVRPVEGFQFTNNAARHGLYGINGAVLSFGNGVISGYFPGGIVQGNWLQGGFAARYPAGNYFSGTFASGFVDSASGDYRASPAGPLVRAATDGTDIGASFQMLAAVLQDVIHGQSVPTTIPAPPGNLRQK